MLVVSLSAGCGSEAGDSELCLGKKKVEGVSPDALTKRLGACQRACEGISKDEKSCAMALELAQTIATTLAATPPAGGSASDASVAVNAAIPAADVEVAPVAAAFAVGEKVKARWIDGTWYPGKIAAANADGSFDIDFSDGDKLKGVPVSKIKSRGSGSGSKSNNASDEPCPGGAGMQRRCGGRCVDILADNNHCGDCGNSCRSGYSCDHMFCKDAEGSLQ